MSTPYDYLIVGNGTAGALLARKLSDQKDKRVLVLEAGSYHDHDQRVLQASGTDLFPIWSELNLTTAAADQWALNVMNPLQTVAFDVGRCWGGGSTINYLVAARGSPEIYNRWAELTGDDRWNYDNLLPAMRAVETYTPNQSGLRNEKQRGSQGPIHITQSPPIDEDPLVLALQQALNIGILDDDNDPTAVSSTGQSHVGFSPTQLFATPGFKRRSSSSIEHLPSSVIGPDGVARDGRQLEIKSNCMVHRVLFNDSKEAVGVEYISGDDPLAIERVYGETIVLCAGSVSSPAILQRSGIGSGDHLKQMGIDVVADQPHVGANLINHYGAHFLTSVPTHASPLLKGMLNTSGLNPPHHYPNDEKRRIQLIGAPISQEQTAITGFIQHPESRGHLRLSSQSPLVRPDIFHNLYSDGDVSKHGSDAHLIVTFARMLAQALGPKLLSDNPELSDEQLFASLTGPGRVALSSHVCGTTRMARSFDEGFLVEI